MHFLLIMSSILVNFNILFLKLLTKYDKNEVSLLLPSAVKVNISASVEYVGKLPVPAAAAALFPPLMKLKSELSPSLVNPSSAQSRQSLL